MAVDDKKTILSTGFNGFARGMADTPERLADREFKYRHTIHAELNLILNASRIGARLEGSDLYVHGLPVCSDCAKSVAQAGFRRVFMCYPDGRPDWEESFSYSKRLFDELGIEVQRCELGDLEDGV